MAAETVQLDLGLVRSLCAQGIRAAASRLALYVALCYLADDGEVHGLGVDEIARHAGLSRSKGQEHMAALVTCEAVTRGRTRPVSYTIARQGPQIHLARATLEALQGQTQAMAAYAGIVAASDADRHLSASLPALADAIGVHRTTLQRLWPLLAEVGAVERVGGRRARSYHVADGVATAQAVAQAVGQILDREILSADVERVQSWLSGGADERRIVAVVAWVSARLVVTGMAESRPLAYFEKAVLGDPGDPPTGELPRSAEGSISLLRRAAKVSRVEALLDGVQAIDRAERVGARAAIAALAGIRQGLAQTRTRARVSVAAPAGAGFVADCDRWMLHYHGCLVRPGDVATLEKWQSQGVRIQVVTHAIQAAPQGARPPAMGFLERSILARNREIDVLEMGTNRASEPASLDEALHRLATGDGMPEGISARILALCGADEPAAVQAELEAIEDDWIEARLSGEQRRELEEWMAEVAESFDPGSDLSAVRRAVARRILGGSLEIAV